MSQVTQISKVDAWVNQAAPATNYGDARIMSLSATASNQRKGLIYFSLPFSRGDHVASAKLQLYLQTWPSSTTVRVNRISGDWNQGTVDWNNLPVIDTVNYDLAAVTGASGTLVEIPIDALMQGVSAGDVWRGLAVSVLGTGANWSVFSSDADNASYAPKLVVTYNVAPQAPSEQLPAGANAISLAQPTYVWQHHRGVEGTGQAKSRVQVWNDTRTAIIYDSTLVANTDSNWPTAGTAHPSLADNDHRWWRVMTQDASGMSSPWSAFQGFYRQSKGPLTFTSPSGTTVNSPTYTFAWNLAGGRTQEAFEMLLYKLPDPGSKDTKKQLWHHPKTHSTATSKSIPQGLIHTNHTYRMILRVWDTINRNSVKGDNAWQEISVDFTYVRPGTYAGPASLTATALGPWVTLAWAMPSGFVPVDYFGVRVNNDERMMRIDPAAVLVSGLNYQMTWWRAQSGVSDTYEVEAIRSDGTNYIHSTANPTSTATTKALGKWLVDDEPGAAVAVQILDRDTPQLTIGESGTTYYPVYSRRPVRITDSVRGQEGTITGHVDSKAKADLLLSLKGSLKTLRLIDKGMNIPVHIGAVSVAPDSDFSPQDYWSVSVEVWQVDEFFNLSGVHIPGGHLEPGT